MDSTFSQQFCTIEPCRADGYFVTGARMHNCLVKIADGELIMVQAPSTRIAKVPVPAVRVVTPRAARKIGTGVVLRLDGKLLNVDFGMVYRRQQTHARQRKSPVAELARNLFSFRNFTTLPQGTQLARELTHKFTAALAAAGAIDEATMDGRQGGTG